MCGLENILWLLGRLAIGGFFLWKAIEKVRHWKEISHELKRRKVHCVSCVLTLSVLVQLVGSLSVIVGFYAEIGALLLGIHKFINMCKSHSLWRSRREVDAERAELDHLVFMKDVAILGGLFLIMAVGSGPFSMDV